MTNSNTAAVILISWRREVSQEVQKVLAGFDPEFSMMSLDEAYLDITDYVDQNSKKYPGNR